MCGGLCTRVYIPLNQPAGYLLICRVGTLPQPHPYPYGRALDHPYMNEVNAGWVTNPTHAQHNTTQHNNSPRVVITAVAVARARVRTLGDGAGHEKGRHRTAESTGRHPWRCREQGVWRGKL